MSYPKLSANAELRVDSSSFFKKIGMAPVPKISGEVSEISNER
ncbi:MAG: hypothetical protein AAFZ15_33370 [Bacteroidota bacterium]